MAGIAVEAESSAVKSRGFQVSLGGLMVLVLAAGLAAGVVRSAREVWGLRTLPAPGAPIGSPVWGSTKVPVQRTAGVILEVAAVCLLVSLARTLIGLFRSARSVDARDWRSRSWGVTWRVGAVCFLFWFIGEESRVLRIDFRKEAEISLWIPGWNYHYQVRQQLLPACGLFALLGLVLGMGASFMFPQSPRRGSRPYWLFVVLAGVAAVLIVALDQNGMLIVQLVLVALEAVTNAMHHHLQHGRGLWTRLLRAGIDAAISAGLCLGLALALARDFEDVMRARVNRGRRAGHGSRCFGSSCSAGGLRGCKHLPRSRNVSGDSSLLCRWVPQCAGSAGGRDDRVLLRFVRRGHGKLRAIAGRGGAALIALGAPALGALSADDPGRDLVRRPEHLAGFFTPGNPTCRVSPSRPSM